LGNRKGFIEVEDAIGKGGVALVGVVARESGVVVVDAILKESVGLVRDVTGDRPRSVILILTSFEVASIGSVKDEGVIGPGSWWAYPGSSTSQKQGRLSVVCDERAVLICAH
jgi:hypothetical protein